MPLPQCLPTHVSKSVTCGKTVLAKMGCPGRVTRQRSKSDPYLVGLQSFQVRFKQYSSGFLNVRRRGCFRCKLN